MKPSENEIQVKEDETISIKTHFLVLPYQGEKGMHIVNSMKRYVIKILPENDSAKFCKYKQLLLEND